jgi:hypothetical protein
VDHGLLTRKITGGHQAKRKKEKRGKNLSPRNRKACHSISTALLKSVAEIGTQSVIKSSIKTLHEFTSHYREKNYREDILLVTPLYCPGKYGDTLVLP